MIHEPTDIPDPTGQHEKRRRTMIGILIAVLSAIGLMCGTLHDFDRRMNDGTGVPNWQQQEANDRADEAHN